MKAILLLNRCSSKGLRHDLVKIHAEVQEVYPQLEFGPLLDPKVEGLHWRDSTVAAFLSRLNEYGHANNRYMTYGYTVMADDLMKVDQLVWSIRRHCRPLKWRTVDEVDQLRRNRRRFALSRSLPIESVLEGKGGEELRTVFLRLNTVFAPDIEHKMTEWRAASSNSPLANYFEYLRAPNASTDTKTLAASVLHWVLNNVEVNRQDRTTIEAALASHQATMPAHFPGRGDQRE